MNNSILSKIIAVVIISVTGAAFGAEKAKDSKMDFTAEQRQTMTVSHEKMATCLRSEKTMDECRMEMMKSCEDTMGKESCSMMGDMHGMNGKMHNMPGMDHKMNDHKMIDGKKTKK